MENKTDSLTPATSKPSATAPVRVQPDCSATVNWFCPACRQWFQTLQMQTESRIQSKVRIRADHIRKGCSAYSPNRWFGIMAA